MSLFTVKANEEKNIVPSELKSVTVYKSGAEMVHTATATLQQGNNELIVDNISNQIDINSIQVKAASAVTVMGVEFSNNYLVPTQKSAHTKLLEDSVEHLQKEVEKLGISLANDKDLLGVLKINDNLKGTQTGLSVVELTKLMDYYKTKSLELQNEIYQLNEKKNKLTDVISKIKEQIDEEQKKNTTKAGRLILQLSAAISGKYDFTISYIATNAYWTPFYDIKVEDIKNPMKLVYKAKITQTTGIDWKKVKLSLSTSLPSQWGNAPELETWYLGYINPVAMRKTITAEVAITGKLAGVHITGASDEIRIRGNGSITKDAAPLYIVNGEEMEDALDKLSPNDIKSIDVLKDASATAVYGAKGVNGVIIITLKNGMEDHVATKDNPLNLSYDIDLPYDIPTNGKAQTVTLQSVDVPAMYKHYAVPKLDKDAYLTAEVVAWDKLNLLQGDANIIFEGTYIGKTSIDPNSTADTLKLTLGKDKRVTVKRDKVADYSSIKFLGSNKLQKFAYEIAVKNNKKDTISLTLKDQYPISTNNDIEVELLEAKGADANKDTGELTWKLTLAPGESRKLRFAYSIKYPKGKVINLN